MRDGFWYKKKVFITGHTGFKGSWLAHSLVAKGANVFGFALQPAHEEDLYHVTRLSKIVETRYGDIRDKEALQRAFMSFQPDVIFHLAAQPLVRESYLDPIATFSTNVMGTVNVLEAAKHIDSAKVIVNVTSDKCYENVGEHQKSFIESDPMGGYDPYSASKGCAELVTASYLRSFYSKNDKYLASARAGNVIGGGDWSNDRIVPDIIRSIMSDKPIDIRQPKAVRPWQHVLDCLNGYMLLAEKLWLEKEAGTGAWNFGPSSQAFKTVEQLVDCSRQYMNLPIAVHYEAVPQPYEAKFLVLNSDKSSEQLGWNTKLDFAEAVKWTMEWYVAYLDGVDMQQFTIAQIKNFNTL